MDVKKPPASTWCVCTTSVSTGLLASWANLSRTLPVEVLTLTMFLADLLCTRVNDPPRYALEQLPLRNAMEFTSPLGPGFQLDTVNGGAARKLNALCRTYLWPPCLMLWNLPTAYIMSPHLTSCLICSVCPLGRGAS